MENNNLDNKLMKDLGQSLNTLTSTANKAIKSLDEKLRVELGPKGYAKYEAYKTKYFALMQAGKVEEAAQLQNTFLSEQV